MPHSSSRLLNRLEAIKENSPIDYVYHRKQIQSFQQALTLLEQHFALLYSEVVNLENKIKLA